MERFLFLHIVSDILLIHHVLVTVKLLPWALYIALVYVYVAMILRYWLQRQLYLSKQQQSVLHFLSDYAVTLEDVQQVCREYP